jgi:hypothetical protein
MPTWTAYPRTGRVSSSKNCGEHIAIADGVIAGQGPSTTEQPGPARGVQQYFRVWEVLPDREQMGMPEHANQPGRPVRVGCWVVGGAAALLCLCCAGVWYEFTRGWTPETVDRLARAACPPGSTREEVKAWLDSDPFPPSRPASFRLFKRTPPYMQGPGRLEYKESVGPDGDVGRLDLNAIGWTIRAAIPDPNPDPICQGTITLVFFFDHEGRLIKHHVSVSILSL